MLFYIDSNMDSFLFQALSNSYFKKMQKPTENSSLTRFFPNFAITKLQYIRKSKEEYACI